MDRQISEAVALFRNSPMLGDDELFEMLVLRGTGRNLAARLVEFVPMVYCRILFQGSGATFPTIYHRLESDGTRSVHEFSGEPVWHAAVDYAKKEVEAGRTEADIRAVAQRGAEYRTASQLLEKGSALQNIAFAPVVFTWPEEGPSGVAAREPQRAKWWPFGSRSRS